jgi:hypothetical protein
MELCNGKGIVRSAEKTVLWYECFYRSFMKLLMNSDAISANKSNEKGEMQQILLCEVWKVCRNFECFYAENGENSFVMENLFDVEFVNLEWNVRVFNLKEWEKFWVEEWKLYSNLALLAVGTSPKRVCVEEECSL